MPGATRSTRFRGQAAPPRAKPGLPKLGQADAHQELLWLIDHFGRETKCVGVWRLDKVESLVGPGHKRVAIEKCWAALLEAVGD